MLNAISPYSAYSSYGAAYAARPAQAQGAEKAQRSALVVTAHKVSQPEAPVQPVTPVRPVDGREDPAQQGLLRFASDPAEMAVRMRIRQPGEEEAAGALSAKAQAAAPEEAKSPQEVMEEGECQTCKERKYQDGSDDPGVSFKTPTKIAPEQAAAAVRGHENEHVVREQGKAQREDRKVVSQTVTYHTGICPECGRVYVSGGTTRTVTAADSQPEQQDAQMKGEQENNPFAPAAVA